MIWFDSGFFFILKLDEVEEAIKFIHAVGIFLSRSVEIIKGKSKNFIIYIFLLTSRYILGI